LAEQIKEFKPRVAGVSDEEAFDCLRCALGVASGVSRWQETELVCGESEILGAIKGCEASVVLAAVVGMAGLPSVIAALESGKDVALANKESLVVAGALVLDKAKASGAKLIPVDSEHSAIFQVLQGVSESDLSSIVLTASGGPFRNTPASEFESITPARALKHPQWSMGAKITIDSATMMNKALEVIEARWLFDLKPEAIEVLVHPQSIVHSMIRLIDGSLLAQLSIPDMKGPIAYALNYPNGRLNRIMQQLDLTQVRELSFEPVDDTRFPGISRAMECLKAADASAGVMNAANEVAVEAFLKNRISFNAIHDVIGEALALFRGRRYQSLGELIGICGDASEWAARRCDLRIK